MESIDLLVQSIVKTDAELSIESKHGWLKQPPPLTCFNNCFKKEDAFNKNNQKNIYPEYYWTVQKLRLLRANIKRHKYANESELLDIKQQINKYEERLKTIPKPQ